MVGSSRNNRERCIIFAIVWRVGDAADLIDGILRLRPDVAVLDLRMLKCHGLESCGMIKREVQTGT